MAARDYGQYDGVTRALEAIGERWALLIVRDLLVGPRRYGELASGLPRMPSNILASRLKELQAAGIVRRAPRSRIIIYELTAYGRELEPLILGLGEWGFRSLGEPRAEQIVTPDAMAITLRSAFRAAVAEELPPTAYGARFSSGDLTVRVDGGELSLSRGSAPADLVFSTGTAISRLISGELGAGRAITDGEVRIEAGDPALLGRFVRTFHLAA